MTLKNLYILVVIILIGLTNPALATTYIIQAEGMMCQACVESVTDGLKSIDADSKVEIDLEKQTITVDIESLTETQVKELLDKRGYKFISISN